MRPASNLALPSGYQLLNYRIDKLLSRGGFSLVYRAIDEHGKMVVIKEYMPHSLALRQEGELVHATSTDNIATFRHGMRCFFEEGRSLARIVHPNVVRVINFFRANDTVYMVMEYERGRSLQAQIESHKHAISEHFIRHVFSHLLTGLREVHTHKLLHLDIKPANIYIRYDGSPVLLDFGAARQTLVSEGARLKPMYTPGFAPPEQYKDQSHLGPRSDIYSVGASIFSCLAGFPPQPADARVKDDRLESAKKVWSGKISDGLLDIVDWCLKLDYMERPQSVFSLQKALIATTPLDPQPESKKRGMMESLRGAFKKTGVPD